MAPGYLASPLIDQMLDNHAEIGLSPAQVSGLESLGVEFLRESIRRFADLQLAWLDMEAMLRTDPADPARPVDMSRVEGKLREVERIRAELEIARLRAIEAGKALLTADQRSKLAAVLADDPSEAGLEVWRTAGSPGGHPAAPGGAHPGGHPPGGQPPVGHPPVGHPPGPQRPGGGAHPGPPPAAPLRPGPHYEGHPDGHRRPGVVVRPWGWVNPYWYPAPVYSYPAPVYIYQQPVSYWYYCPSSRAYYPVVQTCDEPWILVVPSSP